MGKYYMGTCGLKCERNKYKIIDYGEGQSAMCERNKYKYYYYGQRQRGDVQLET